MSQKSEGQGGRGAAPGGRIRLGGPLLALIVISMASNILMLAGPLYMLQIYDRVLTSRSVPTLVVLTLLIAVLYAYYALIEALRGRIVMRMANALDASITERLFSAMVRSRLSPAASANADPLREGETLRQFISGSGPLALLDLPWMVVYLGIVFIIHPSLGWLATCGAIVIVMLAGLNEMLSRAPAQRVNAILAAHRSNADSVRASAETAIGMGMLPDLERRHRVLNDELLRVQRRASDLTGWFSSTIKGLRFLLQSGVLAVGAYLAISGEMTAGLMIAAAIITSRALAPVDQIVGQWRSFIAARQSLHRIRAILKAADGARVSTLLPMPHKTINLTQFATAPQGGRFPVIAGANFDLAAGEAMAILGASGSGKSSLLRGIIGIWPALAGSVRFDGALSAQYDTSQIGDILGYLPQRVELFDGTIAENISRFRANATPEAIIAAARAAKVHDLILSFPRGYDSPVGDQGQLLSAGQNQRIGLARALYGNPFLVVLDEPDSNLDAEGDAALAEAITLAKGRGAVVLVVAHRPGILAIVDKVLVMREGRQIAFGPRNEVLAELEPVKPGGNVRTIRMPVA